MSKQDMGGPAFPAPDFAVTKEIADEKLVMRLKNLQGMTLWDYYAAAALQGYIASPSADPHCTFEDMASDAAIQADAMLAERAKRQEGGDE